VLEEKAPQEDKEGECLGVKELKQTHPEPERSNSKSSLCGTARSHTKAKTKTKRSAKNAQAKPNGKATLPKTKPPAKNQPSILSFFSAQFPTNR
jgi:hypothetical protein